MFFSPKVSISKARQDLPLKWQRCVWLRLKACQDEVTGRMEGEVLLAGRRIACILQDAI